MMSDANAPGHPGAKPVWTSARKCGVGTALSKASRVWFTIAEGVLTEIYYPAIDSPCARELAFFVTDGRGTFSAEKSDTEHEVRWLQRGVPGFQVINRCVDYRIEKQIITDQERDALLVRVRFAALKNPPRDHFLYVSLTPHIGNRGDDNTAWVAECNGEPMLFAQRDTTALALGCSVGWKRRSAGFVGESDLATDLHRHHEMRWQYERAERGNVALGGEINLAACGGEFLLAVGFGNRPEAAGHHVRAALLRDFDEACRAFCEPWRQWQQKLQPLDQQSGDGGFLYRSSVAIIRSHDAKEFPGGAVASLTIPWGPCRPADGTAGYHVVWTRDLVEMVGSQLASGAHSDARRVLAYLAATQKAEGNWPQNMWADGTANWHGVQLDEVGFPILLADLAYRERAVSAGDLGRLWPVIRRAAEFIVRNGPVTPQERWEHNAGYSPSTIAVEIAALLATAKIAEALGHGHLAGELRDTADSWNDNIERWTYVTDTKLARQHDVEGHYIWIRPPPAKMPRGKVRLQHRHGADRELPAEDIVSPDALVLVRLGLRAANDPRILNTLKIIDATLRVETPRGAAWHRYTGDAYGEHDDGSCFDGTGEGRAWPLLTGERAHYEIAAGHLDAARDLASAVEAFAGETRLLPEQVWDESDIPTRGLFKGQPTGSACPLVWAHAEYVKLLRSFRDGRVFDMPPHTLKRYLHA